MLLRSVRSSRRSGTLGLASAKSVCHHHHGFAGRIGKRSASGI